MELRGGGDYAVLRASGECGVFRRREHGDIFFFSSRRRHTRFDCDWSSDVCSSDLAEIGHCVHHIAMNGKRPNTLFMQKHWDVMRSDDAGDNWKEVSGNLPTDFGFVKIGRASCRERV